MSLNAFQSADDLPVPSLPRPAGVPPGPVVATGVRPRHRRIDGQDSGGWGSHRLGTPDSPPAGSGNARTGKQAGHRGPAPVLPDRRHGPSAPDTSRDPPCRGSAAHVGPPPGRRSRARAGTPGRPTPRRGGAPRGPSSRRGPGRPDGGHQAQTAALATAAQPARPASGLSSPAAVWSEALLSFPLFTGEAAEDRCAYPRSSERLAKGHQIPVACWSNEVFIKRAGPAKGWYEQTFPDPDTFPAWNQLTRGFCAGLAHTGLRRG